MIKINITLEDAYNGGRKEVEYDRQIICPECKGSGSSNPNENPICLKCNGTGVRWIIQNQGLMTLRTETACDECEGEGKIIKEKCNNCKGKMVQNIKRKIGIDLERGVPDGHKYKIANEGDEFPGFEIGYLIIEIFLQKHKEFIRKGADLYYKYNITLLEALTGVKIIFNYLDGRRILIQSNPNEIIQTGELKIIDELGMPLFNSPLRYGNLYIEFKIVFPNKLTEEQKKKMNEIFKKEKNNNIDDLCKDMEKYYLKDYNDNEKNSYYKEGKEEDWKGEKTDEDGEDKEYHREINCTSQ